MYKKSLLKKKRNVHRCAIFLLHSESEPVRKCCIWRLGTCSRDYNNRECTGYVLRTGCLWPQRTLWCITGKTEGTFYDNMLWVPWYALHSYSYAEMLYNKEWIEKRSKKGIALMIIASNVHFTARSAMPWPLNYMKQIEGVIENVLHQ